MTLCPCCQQPLPGPLPRNDLSDINMSAQQHLMLEALIASYPRDVSCEHIGDCLYRVIDDEPLDINRILSVVRVKINRRIRQYGWQVSNARRRGWGANARYRLERNT